MGYLKVKNESTQPTAKAVVVLKQGRVWKLFPSIHGMCEMLEIDRRAVLRVLQRQKNYNSVKGMCFVYAFLSHDQYKRNCKLPAEHFTLEEEFYGTTTK